MGVAKKLPFTNITVNSPIAKRKMNNEVKERDAKTEENKRIHEKSKIKDVETKGKRTAEVIPTKELRKRKEVVNQKVVLPERRRTKTRTLEEEEIKILTPDVVDNNLEMLNLTKRLSAQPKAFYVDLNEQTQQRTSEQPKESDEEVSYEDDFESYESDFESYQSESKSDHSCTPDDNYSCGSNEYNVDRDCPSNNDCYDNTAQANDESHSKDERMLDSGNFDLRDPRSVNKTKPMDYIIEGSEDIDKKISLTDEGFQEMSSSSGLSSMKTLHIDILDRPLFIDFTKSKENRRKRKIFERLQQRADDILSMVTLHEMSYDLYEMKPIPYDLYMATFGRFNYTQTAVQTFEDGITTEIQTEDILMTDKWTQNPIEFSNNHYLDSQKDINIKKKGSIENFTFLFNNDQDDINNIIDESYQNNPLRIYLEQKDGVGTNKVLSYENYKIKLKNNEYDHKKLRKFLKKVESRISNMLSRSSGNALSNLNKTSKFPFSNEYLLIKTTDIKVHSKLSTGFNKCVLSLWDLSIDILKPLKILLATNDVKIARFRGSTSGFIVGGLCDGTILLWDLSEEATWCYNIADGENSSKTVDIDSKTYSERRSTLQVCAYTSSALNLSKSELADSIVGLEFMGVTKNMDYDRKILAQICSLQSIGIITIWSIIHEKTKHLKHDIGKALWSTMKLERNQIINLAQHIDSPLQDAEITSLSFNLNSAKKRMAKKRLLNRTKVSRPISAIAKCQEDSSSVASKNNFVDKTDSLDNNIVCNHFKIMNLNGVENFLVAKNGGEVLCCRRDIGSFKVKTFCVSNSASSLTCIEASPHGLPYFLAATNCGTVNMCSLLDYRVLLTLDCR
ncbi:jg3227 [Pararge aegeria aegeria]|uniref:Jg3227 protein n=1 Tax=Pararge aegeria aegeria TaxID=348720 RepID=A0A8S4RU67_9NEOP|nr:jg3227 [Pararge aegeria aegeria]